MNTDSQKTTPISYKMLGYSNRNSPCTHVLMRNSKNYLGYVYLNAKLERIPTTQKEMHTLFVSHFRE